MGEPNVPPAMYSQLGTPADRAKQADKDAQQRAANSQMSAAARAEDYRRDMAANPPKALRDLASKPPASKPPAYKRGGKIRASGKARLHKGERMGGRC